MQRHRGRGGASGCEGTNTQQTVAWAHDALHLEGQLDPGLCGGDPDGERELALRVLTVGAARRPKGV